MNVLVKSIYLALKELTDGNKLAAIKFGKYNYFEIRTFLRGYIKNCGSILDSGEYIYTDGDTAIYKPNYWPEGLVSLYIDIPFSNIQTDTSGLNIPM